jgi:hypothetical protein
MKKEPKLLAIADFDGDSRTEVFTSWGTYLHHFQVFRLASDKDSTLLCEFQIESGPISSVDFPLASKKGKVNAAIVTVMGGAKWSEYHVLLPGKKRPVKLGDASHLKLRDLDGDGAYEWVLFQWRGSDTKCSYGFFGLGDSVDIFQLSGNRFVSVWPPSDWAALDADVLSEIRFGRPQPQWKSDGTQVSAPWKPIPWERTYLVMNRFYDLDDDGRMEIITITDVLSKEDSRRQLSVYKLRNRFTRLAYVDLSPDYPAIAIMGIRRLKDRKQIVVRQADVNRCGDDVAKLQEGVMTAAGYDFRNGELKQSWVNDTIDITLEGTVKDLDEDGNEEMIFTPGEHNYFPQGPVQKMPVILKGIRDFLPYTSSK